LSEKVMWLGNPTDTVKLYFTLDQLARCVEEIEQKAEETARETQQIEQTRQVEPMQLTPLQRRILEVLKAEGRPMRPGEIAEKVYSTDASVRNALRKLEKLGLVKRLYIRKCVYYELAQRLC